MNILVVDSLAHDRAKLIDFIDKDVHNVDESLFDKTALDAVHKKCPDLILMNWHNQENVETAFSLVKQIRQIGGAAVWVPITFIVDKMSDTMVDNIIESGADGALDNSNLKLQLKLHLNSAQRLKDLKEEIFNIAHNLVLTNRALEGLSSQDVLTGLANNNSFEEQLTKEWQQAKKAETDLALIMLDIDFFKSYNDMYGTEKGDECLKQIASQLKQFTPNHGHCARILGATFAVILPGANQDMALVWARQFQDAINSLGIENKASHNGGNLTISVGVTVIDSSLQAPKDLIEVADYAMYQAKHYGRNQCRLVLSSEG